MDKNIHKCLNALNNISSLGLNGAQGRNRTTDTRIFNGAGVSYIFIISDLCVYIFSVLMNVFLMSLRGWGGNTVLNRVSGGTFGKASYGFRLRKQTLTVA